MWKMLKNENIWEILSSLGERLMYIMTEVVLFGGFVKNGKNDVFSQNIFYPQFDAESNEQG